MAVKRHRLTLWQNRGIFLKTKVAYYGVFTALALIFSYIETLVPLPIAIPGIKIGLANLIIVFALYKLKIGEVTVLSVVRVLLVGALFGSLFSVIYSLAGAIVSLGVMYLLKKTEKFSVIGISMAGGVFHNIGQLIVAGIVLESLSVIYYAPVLLVAGVVTGIVIGIVSNEVIKRLQKV